MAFMVGHWQLAGSGSWVVEHKETGAFMGMVGYSEPEGWLDLELAWKLVPRWRGYGR
jgi:RimJ/RimL family protein N-acetyltransferase